MPYVEKSIKDIKSEDSKISVTGMIVEKGPDYLILDDSTGTLLVRTSSFIESGFVKVFGNLLRFSENLELNSHLIKDLAEIDKDIFKTLKAQYIN